MDLLQIGWMLIPWVEHPQNSVESGSNTEQRMDVLALSHHVPLSQPPNLPLADQMHRFVTLNGAPSSFRRAESQTRGNSLLDKTVVLFDDVVLIR